MNKIPFLGGSKKREKSIIKWNNTTPINRLKIMRAAGIEFGDKRSLRKKQEIIYKYLEE